MKTETKVREIKVHGKKKFGNVTPKKRTAKEVSKCRNVSAYLG